MSNSTRARIRRRRALLAAAAAGAALLAPAAADAAVTATITPTGVSVTGDDLPNAITVGEAGGLLTHNLPTGPGTFNSASDWNAAVGGDQTVAGNAASTIVAVQGAGGDDTLTVTAATLLRSEMDGGPGNDLITGTAKNDVLAGGDGNDRIIGFRGDDDMDGGAGNDVLVWNNGDGSDTMDGDAGADEIEVNGAATAGDVFRVAPGAVAPRVFFERTNLGTFNLNILAERLTVNGLGGDDSVDASAPGLAPLILMTLSGGVGLDALTGGDGPDLILGGDENDTLRGLGGDDRIVGDRGNDAMAGGDGDDTMVWSNGDGSDTMQGEAGFDRAEVNGSLTGADVIGIAPNGGLAHLERTNVGQFAIDIGTSESLDLNTFGGDDTFSAAAGTAALLREIDVDGGSGNDTLTTAEGDDVVSGGSGNDKLTGGPGYDVLDGNDGDDSLFLLDGKADLGKGGPGRDTALADRKDTLVGIESATQPKPLALLNGVAPAKQGAIWIRVHCDAPGGCAGRLHLTTYGAVRVGPVRAQVLLGDSGFAVGAGKTKLVRIALAPGSRALAVKRILAARVTAQVESGYGYAKVWRAVAIAFPKYP